MGTIPPDIDSHVFFNSAICNASSCPTELALIETFFYLFIWRDWSLPSPKVESSRIQPVSCGNWIQDRLNTCKCRVPFKSERKNTEILQTKLVFFFQPDDKSRSWRFPVRWRWWFPPPKTASYMFGIHPRKLTWNVKMNPWKRRFLLETIIFRFHVCFRGGSTSRIRNAPKKPWEWLPPTLTNRDFRPRPPKTCPASHIHLPLPVASTWIGSACVCWARCYAAPRIGPWEQRWWLFLRRGGCSRGGGNWGTLTIQLGKIGES